MWSRVWRRATRNLCRRPGVPQARAQQGDENTRSQASGPRLVPQEHGGCPAEAGRAPKGNEAGAAGVGEGGVESRCSQDGKEGSGER